MATLSICSVIAAMPLSGYFSCFDGHPLWRFGLLQADTCSIEEHGHPSYLNRQIVREGPTGWSERSFGYIVTKQDRTQS